MNIYNWNFVTGHLQHDVLGYVYCCKWGKATGATCDKYLTRRPTDDCSDYDRPRWGNPTQCVKLHEFMLLS